MQLSEVKPVRTTQFIDRDKMDVCICHMKVCKLLIFIYSNIYIYIFHYHIIKYKLNNRRIYLCRVKIIP